MRQYAIHRRFISDVDRIVNQDSLEKVIIFAMHYFSLRQVHSDEISNEEIAYVVGKLHFTDTEIPELYKSLSEDLTNQEFIFRIKRIKYVRNTKDSIMIVASPLMKRLGKYMNREVHTVEIEMFDEGNEKSQENKEPISAIPDAESKFVKKFKRGRILCTCGKEYGDGAWYIHRKKMGGKDSGHEIKEKIPV